ncbi:hypothetical protein PTTG_01173 [Puccinia triticina 1-1 BBBD Race 1]|uniref:Uncharacterized protein n=2 Tax=Puccinia triticina TaxID=208348 RepID=A0A0C4EK98_PUCT1|nr:hypothetical protein PTTG_01173 [Puccinia triticina 1-1 BBBD Race 1]
MGGTGADFRLPNPPTPEELQAWKDRVAERQAKVHAHHAASTSGTDPENVLDITKLAHLQPTHQQPSCYQSAAMPANHEISQFYKLMCDHQFQCNGFPRVTFEWHISSLRDSEWNSATAVLLAEGWRRWYLQNRLFSTADEPIVDAKAVIGRWIESAPSVTIKGRQPQPGTGDEEALAGQWRPMTADEHRSIRSEVADARKRTVETIFPNRGFGDERYKLTGLVTIDSTSDYEDAEEPGHPPTRIDPYWRSSIFGEFLHALDRASFQLLAAPARKGQLAGVLARNGHRAANEADASAEHVPRGIPEEACSAEFLSDTSKLERRQLRITEDDIGGLTIAEALAVIQKYTSKPKY